MSYTRPRSRLPRLTGLLVALLLAVLGSHVTLLASSCYPLCAIWTDANPEWYVFLCFLC